MQVKHTSDVRGLGNVVNDELEDDIMRISSSLGSPPCAKPSHQHHHGVECAECSRYITEECYSKQLENDTYDVCKSCYDSLEGAAQKELALVQSSIEPTAAAVSSGPGSLVRLDTLMYPIRGPDHRSSRSNSECQAGDCRLPSCEDDCASPYEMRKSGVFTVASSDATVLQLCS